MTCNVTQFLRNKWQQAFRFFDENNDGDLSEEDFVAIAHYMCNKTGASPEQITKTVAEWVKWFGYLQNYPSLRLDETSYAAACKKVCSDLENHKKQLAVHASEMFDRLDDDNGGTISLDEFSIFYQAVGIHNSAITQDSFKNIDKDGDGCIQREEFIDDFVRHFTDPDPVTGVTHLLSADKK